MYKVSSDVPIYLVNWKRYEKVKYLPLDCNNQIWTPDIHDIKNQRVLLHPDIIEPLRIIRDGEFEYFLMIFHLSSFWSYNSADISLFSDQRNDRIVQTTELIPKSSCQMDIKDYPFDLQTCSYELTSLRHDHNAILFNVSFNDSSEMSNFAPEYTFKIFSYDETHRVELEDYTQVSRGEIGKRKNMKMSTSTSLHSIIGFEIRFARSFSKYLWTYFLPSFLAVFIAGCSFIIPPSSVPGRMMLLVTLFLVQMELLQSLQVSSKYGSTYLYVVRYSRTP